jgi:hypothetical protein
MRFLRMAFSSEFPAKFAAFRGQECPRHSKIASGP